MEAIVLAGGFGTRLRQVVPDLPKPMAPVCGRPFLELLLGRLAQQGFAHVVLSLGYLAERIVAHFGDRYRGLRLSYEIEREPLGTGGAVRAALQRCTQPHVYVFNGDTFLDLETAQVESSWQQFGEPIIVTRSVADAARYGRIETDGARILRFVEKGEPGPGLINAGCYVIPRSMLDAYATGVRFSLEQDYFYTAVQSLPFRVFVSAGLFIDIGVPEDYARAQRELAPFAA